MKRVFISVVRDGKHYQKEVPVYNTYELWGYTVYLVKNGGRYFLAESLTGMPYSALYKTLKEAKKSYEELASRDRRHEFISFVDHNLFKHGFVKDYPVLTGDYNE